MMKKGFFGGTFDPIHNGHINLALSMLELYGLDEIILCPAHISPLKTPSPLASAQHRLNMVSLVSAKIPRFSVLDFEISNAPPSYTIETLRYLVQKNENTSYRLIMGEDALVNLFRWREIDELLKLAPPLIASRSKEVPCLSHLPSTLINIVQKGMSPIPIMEISSTQIRHRLRQKKYCGHLVPEEVLTYIYKNNLYLYEE